ncbi:hypothetical protein D9757_006801 [Collybiopsis confluens]|uniref:Uncharacterized protein n=1 Tax=Collybiopsis confluens TaxID=2823264 RepID=A0A8H5M9F8_9AGAR|nr:hypothetical protein D9757_006801 [Collybiopsis confluens]
MHRQAGIQKKGFCEFWLGIPTSILTIHVLDYLDPIRDTGNDTSVILAPTSICPTPISLWPRRNCDLPVAFLRFFLVANILDNLGTDDIRNGRNASYFCLVQAHPVGARAGALWSCMRDPEHISRTHSARWGCRRVGYSFGVEPGLKPVGSVELEAELSYVLPSEIGLHSESMAGTATSSGYSLSISLSSFRETLLTLWIRFRQNIFISTRISATSPCILPVTGSDCDALSSNTNLNTNTNTQRDFERIRTGEHISVADRSDLKDYVIDIDRVGRQVAFKKGFSMKMGEPVPEKILVLFEDILY